MPFCSLCDKERHKQEMLKDKRQPDGIGTVCVFCRDERNRLRQLRLFAYEDSLSQMMEMEDKDLDIKELLKVFEKKVIANCVKYSESVAETARVLGIARSTLAMKFSNSNEMVINKTVVEKHPREGDWKDGKRKRKGELWRARIVLKCDRIFLGKFDTKDEADHVYRTAHLHQNKYQRNDRAGFISMVLEQAGVQR